jgi:hypothetical protein
MLFPSLYLLSQLLSRAQAQRRRTTGTGRCRYIKSIARKAKNGFREGTCQ